MWSLLLSRQGDPPGTFLDRRQIDSGQIKIGRGTATCDWTINDTTGFLSREHCLISAIGLDLFVSDTSTNGVALNDPSARIVPHNPVAIRIGDRLLLGDYVIRVATEAEGLSAQIGSADFGQPLAAPAPEFVQTDNWFDNAATSDPIWGGSSRSEVHDFLGGAMHDFLAPAGGGAQAAPWQEPLGGALSEAFSRPILAEPVPNDFASFGIPENWDAPVSAPSPVVPPSPAPDPFKPSPGAVPAASPFDTPVPAAADDPFAALMKPASVAGFGAIDPFADFDMPPPANAPAGLKQLDHDPFAAAMGTSPPPPADTTVPPSPHTALPAAGSPREADQSSAGGSNDASWAAFCEGAGIEMDALRRAPDAMRRLGIFYRQVVLGLSDMIQDRAAFKDEFRVERTQLSMGRNNPLKHLPALDSAKLLLADPLPGFLGSEEAVRLALEDIKKHQLAMLAGVQAALKSVFDRLAPAEVERIMQQAAAKRKGFTFGRGIDPWSVYQTLFDALRADATSNRNSVMSVAFREGYEEFLRGTK
jgi:type VI secretion system FHA domain protein